MKFSSQWDYETLLRVLCFLIFPTICRPLHTSNDGDKPHKYYKSKSSSEAQDGYTEPFNNEQDIIKYLKVFHTDAMIWRCNNALQHTWNWAPIPYMDLKCETIGVLREVSWHHGDKQLDLDHSKHYKQKIWPHNHHGQYYSRWLDFTLRIYNATAADTGVYTFKITSVAGRKLETQIYIDISSREREHERHLWRRARRRFKRKYRKMLQKRIKSLRRKRSGRRERRGRKHNRTSDKKHSKRSARNRNKEKSREKNNV